jgi:hypothetical protein
MADDAASPALQMDGASVTIGKQSAGGLLASFASFQRVTGQRVKTLSFLVVFDEGCSDGCVKGERVKRCHREVNFWKQNQKKSARSGSHFSSN